MAGSSRDDRQRAKMTTAITRIEVVLADIPTIRPHVLAMVTMMAQTMVLVFIERADGIVGVGEATTIGGLAYGAESPESIKANITAYFAPLLIGRDADDPADMMALLDQHIVGNRFAKCAVETALLDGLGQAQGISVGELLGGRLQQSLQVAWTLASGDTDTDIAEGERVLAAKLHRDFKLKIGKRDVAADCAHVAAIARAFEGRASIRADVNQHWTREQAAEGARLLQDAGVDLIEQPIAKHDVAGMKTLCDDFDIAIMADEALTGPISAAPLVEHKAADVFALKITQSGGLTKTRALADMARTAGIALYGGTMLEGAIGTVASAHLFSTMDRLEWGTELFGPLLMTEEILEEPLVYRDFQLEIPRGPGLGLKIDRDKLARFARD